MTLALSIDPADLQLPTSDLEEWLEWVGALSELVAEDAVVGMAPHGSVNGLMAAASDWERIAELLAAAKLGIRPDELIRLIDPLSARLLTSPLSEGEAALSQVELDPEYVGEIDATLERAWLDHLGLLAIERFLRERMIAVLSRSANWQSTRSHVEIRAAVGLLLDRSGDLDERLLEGDVVREFASRLQCVQGVLSHLAEMPCFLIGFPTFGTRATWHGKLGERGSLPRFEIGPGFGRSVEAMNYARQPRRAAACLRVMALIAGGRREAIAGHPERDGSGAGNPILRDTQGNTVHRAYLAQKSPNAHRLFWVDGAAPRFLNVGGHESQPII